MDDLAPGERDATRVATERILYRSAEERVAATTRNGPRGDSMDVDFGDMEMPLETVER